MELVKCPRCGLMKPPRKWKYYNRCKACDAARMVEHRKLHPDTSRRVRRKYETPLGRAKGLIAAGKGRSGASGIEAGWLAKKIENGKCDVTGVRFDLGPQKDGRGQNPLAPSLDKIDPDAGYVPGNVQVVIFAFNAFKGRMTQSEAVSLLRSMADGISGAAHPRPTEATPCVS